MAQKTKKSASRRQSSLAAIKRHRTAKLASLATKAYYLHRRGQDDNMYDLICDEFISLGGIYVKFLQGVLLQSDVMRRRHDLTRLKIFENLDHEPLDIVAVLRQELPAEKLAQIALVQPQPFAAGSFGQVYYGQLADGRPIVIKAIRPLVRELLRYDLRLITVFSHSLVSKASNNIDIDLTHAMKDFRMATLRETDYIAEARFAHELHEIYKDHPTMVIPETFIELSTTNIIVQEYVDGLSVAQLIHLKEQGVDPKTYVAETLGSDLDQQLETLGLELLRGSFDFARIQGDPHPGNVRLLKDNKVGMIDFGISAPTPKNKAAFFGVVRGWHEIYAGDLNITKLFEQFMRFFVNDLYRALQRLSELSRKPLSDNEAENYTQTMGRIAHETFKKSVGVVDIRPMIEDGRIIQVINQLINKDNRFGLVLKLEASEILRASQTYVSLTEALGRRGVVLPKVFSGVVTYVEQAHPDLVHETDAPISVSDAIDTVSNWLERVAIKDPDFFSHLMQRIKLNSSHSRTKTTSQAIPTKQSSEAVKETINA